MWYSNVLTEFFQIVITTSERSEKSLRRFYLSSQFVRNFVWHCQPATLPTHFRRIFSSKLVGLRGWGEPGQFFRKLWISCRLQ
jgi:hypothetical protein